MSQEGFQSGRYGINDPDESKKPHAYSSEEAATPVAPTPPPPQKQRRSNNWIYWMIIALLLGMNIYQYMDKTKRIRLEQQIVVQRDSAVQTRDLVQQEYDAAIARLDDLVGKNTMLNSQIQNKDGEIAKLRSQIDGIMKDRNATTSDMAKAQSLIKKLNGRVRGYEDRISELEGTNRRLSGENTSLAQERDSAVTESGTLRKLGSVLHASNIRMIAIDVRRNGTKEKETGKARRADVLRLYLDIDENRIAQSGTKELLLRILAPDGSLLSNAAYGSGVTTTAVGENLGYTLSKQVLLTTGQPVQDITIDWKQDSDYKKGNYAIEVYHDGYKIGSGSVTLK